MLLQPYLGGKGRMALLTFVENNERNRDEIVRSLQFAVNAKRVVNHPTINVVKSQ